MGESGKIYEVDLKSCIEKYVWRRFEQDNTCLKNMCFKKDDHFLDIRWGYVDFKHTTTWTNRPLPIEEREQTIDLYVSEYDNNTAETQKFKFTAQHNTTATATIELQNTYSIGVQSNLQVNVAGTAKFSVGVSASISVTDTKGTSHTELQSWTIDSDVEVPTKHKAKATLRLKKINKVTDFEVKTIVRLPEYILPVSIRKKADNEIVKTYSLLNLSSIFDEDYLERSADTLKILKKTIEGTDMIDTQLELTSRGVCKSSFGKKQNVEIEYKPLITESNVSEDAEEGDKEHTDHTTTEESANAAGDKSVESEKQENAENGIDTINSTNASLI